MVAPAPIGKKAAVPLVEHRITFTETVVAAIVPFAPILRPLCEFPALVVEVSATEYSRLRFQAPALPSGMLDTATHCLRVGTYLPDDPSLRIELQRRVAYAAKDANDPYTVLVLSPQFAVTGGYSGP